MGRPHREIHLAGHKDLALDVTMAREYHGNCSSQSYGTLPFSHRDGLYGLLNRAASA